MPQVYVKRPKRDGQDSKTAQWHTDVKYKALALYSQGMGRTELSRTLLVPRTTIDNWIETDWWKDGLKSIQEEEYHKLDKVLTDNLELALQGIQDRMKNGDAIYDPRTGKIRQIPVKLRDLNHSFNTLMSTRQTVRNLPSKIIENSNASAQLANLASEFAKFVSGKTKTEDPLKTIELIEGETVVQDEDGTWVMPDYIQEQDDAIHEERPEGLQEGASVGTHQEEEPCEGQSPTQCSEGNSGQS